MKRSVCVILLTIVALLLCCFTAVAEEGVAAIRMLGDANKDGKVNTTDARVILQCVAGKSDLSDAIRVLSNVDGDERLSTTDARFVLQYTVGRGPVSKDPTLTIGEPALFDYGLAQLPIETKLLFQMMGVTVEEGEVPYFVMQMDAKQQLEELVTVGTSFLGPDGITPEAKAYLEARDEAFFATDSVIMVLYPETLSRYAEPTLTRSPNGEWTLGLQEYPNTESAVAPSANALRVLVMDVDREALDGSGVTSVVVTQAQPTEPAE